MRLYTGQLSIIIIATCLVALIGKTNNDKNNKRKFKHTITKVEKNIK